MKILTGTHGVSAKVCGASVCDGISKQLQFHFKPLSVSDMVVTTLRFPQILGLFKSPTILGIQDVKSKKVCWAPVLKVYHTIHGLTLMNF